MGTEEKQSRMDNSIKKVEGIDADYLAKYVEEDKSLESLKEHRIVPRFKIIQATSDSELTNNFGIGSVIVRPGDALICKHNAEPDSFDFVPLFFFVEFAKWRDLKDNGPMILERSHDQTSELAIKAKNAEKRRELYPGMDGKPENERMYYNYVEHLRFIGVIHGDHPLVGTPVTLSFERGEWSQGKNLISAISLRRQTIQNKPSSVPLWAQVWSLKTIYHAPDATRKWYGFKFEPADPSIIPPEEAEAMRSLHLEFKDLFEKQRLMVQDDEESVSQDEAAVKAHTEF
jgi:hypothetical protein